MADALATDPDLKTELRSLTDELAQGVTKLSFSEPVVHVYNPLGYARHNYDEYLERYGASLKEVLLVGMNPGPWGMVQTGVPFGEVDLVRQWLGIRGSVEGPQKQHPARPIEGFDCPRNEVSGQRLWSWAKARFGEPKTFFERFFVHNYCPLAFLEESGRNRTPDKLPVAEREPLFEVCDRALVRTVRALSPRWVVGIGAFAERSIRRALDGHQGEELQLGRILHPSPASPAANRGWAEQAERQLEELGVELP